MVTIDAGSDLSNGPQGPWLTQEDRRSSSPWTIFAPTIQHNPKIWTRSNPAKPATSTKSQERFPQSAQLLAQYCGEILDTQTMVLDPFYAITDLFQFCAFSEIQFMNVMEAKIKEDTDYSSLMKENPTLSNLLYSRDCSKALDSPPRDSEDYQVLRWPSVATRRKRPSAPIPKGNQSQGEIVGGL